MVANNASLNYFSYIDLNKQRFIQVFIGKHVKINQKIYYFLKKTFS